MTVEHRVHATGSITGECETAPGKRLGASVSSVATTEPVVPIQPVYTPVQKGTCAIDDRDAMFTEWSPNQTMSYASVVKRLFQSWREPEYSMVSNTELNTQALHMSIRAVNPNDGQIGCQPDLICSVGVTFRVRIASLYDSVRDDV